MARKYSSSYMLFLSEEQRNYIQAESARTGISSAQIVRNLIQDAMTKARAADDENEGK